MGNKTVLETVVGLANSADAEWARLASGVVGQ